jgi:hypothetical protein
VFFKVILHGLIFKWQISFLYFNFFGLMQCSKTLSVISSTDWERTIQAMKLHQYFEFGPSSQVPFSFCQIQLALDTVYSRRELIENTCAWMTPRIPECFLKGFHLKKENKKYFKMQFLDVIYLKRLLPAITPPGDHPTCNVTSVTSKLPATDCIVFKSNTTHL